MIDLDSPPDHCAYDPARVQLHRRALQLMRPNSGIDYLEAVRMAAGEYHVPAGFTVDPERLRLHLVALRTMAPAQGVGYLEAALLAEKVAALQPAPRANPPPRASPPSSPPAPVTVTLAGAKPQQGALMYVRLVGGIAEITR